MKFAIGRGHGLYTAGKRCLKSIDPNQTREFVLNDRIADKVEQKLGNYECEVITIGDTTGVMDILLASRVNTVNKAKPDMYISIHHNAGINGGSGGGTEVYYTGTNPNRPRQAKALYDAIIKETGLVGNRSQKVIKKGFYVLAKTNCPALLCELGYMDSKVDTPIILTEEYAEKCANGIVNFLVAEFSLKEKVVAQKKTVDEIAKEVINGKWGNGTARKTALTNAGYNYAEVQKKVDELLGNKNTTATTNNEIKVGSTVKLKKGAKTYTGGKLASFVYSRKHKVKSISGDRVVITYCGIVIAAVRKSDLTLA